MSETASYTKMEKLNFEAGLHNGLKDVQRGTKIPYPTLININRGFQMIKGKKCKYYSRRGTQKILEDFYGVPWEEIFEDKSAEDLQDNSLSAEKAINETFTISTNTKN